MELSCPLGTTRCIRQEKFPQSHIINHLLTKLVLSRWLGFGPSLFCEFMDLDFASVYKHAKNELGQYPALLTSHLVNNSKDICMCSAGILANPKRACLNSQFQDLEYMYQCNTRNTICFGLHDYI